MSNFDLKYCTLCKLGKTVENFHKNAFYCKDCANRKSREWHLNNKHIPEVKLAKRDSYIKHKYGLTLNEYLEKLDAQDTKCAICLVKLQTSGSGTHLDHCHKTGKLRAFLCTNCNRGLGHFKDSITNLKSAIDYLGSHISDVDTEKER